MNLRLASATCNLVLPLSLANLNLWLWYRAWKEQGQLALSWLELSSNKESENLHSRRYLKTTLSYTELITRIFWGWGKYLNSFINPTKKHKRHEESLHGGVPASGK